MDNKEELLEAIQHYNLFTPKFKMILKTLIDLAINNRVIITIKELSELSDASKLIVYKTIRLLEEKKMLEIAKRPKSRLSEFLLKPEYLEEIIKYYKVYAKVKNKSALRKKEIDRQ